MTHNPLVLGSTPRGPTNTISFMNIQASGGDRRSRSGRSHRARLRRLSTADTGQVSSRSTAMGGASRAARVLSHRLMATLSRPSAGPAAKSQGLGA